MQTHVEKTQDNKHKSDDTVFSQKQNNSDSALQFVDNRPEAIFQRKFAEMANGGSQVSQLQAFQSMADNHSTQQQQIIQKKENNTGLPDNLKTGIENLSGYQMDDVKVHYNSDKPAQLQAHAYAQGTDIHLGGGQEKHLPHEAWHVVQQKQGRVKPTMQMKGKVNVNDDSGLEKEADVMGAKAIKSINKETLNQNSASSPGYTKQLKTVQRSRTLSPTPPPTTTTTTAPPEEKSSGTMDAIAGATDSTLAVADQSIGIAKLDAGNDKSLFNVNNDNLNTGAEKTNDTTGTSQDVAHGFDSAASVAGTLLQGFNTFKSWKTMKETDDPIAKADTALQGTKFVFGAVKTVMNCAKSTEVAGLIPGIGSGLSLLEAGLSLMKDKRAKDVMKKIESEVYINPEEEKLLHEYGNRVHWKMIEDGAEAMWSVAELIGLAFPGVSAGISFLHGGANLLKNGVKMYRSYGAGKRDKAASRLEVGDGSEGITEGDKKRLSKTGELVKNAGKSHIDFVRLLRLQEEETRLTALDVAPGGGGDKAKLDSITSELNAKINKYNKLFGKDSNIKGAENISRAEISSAKSYFVTMVRNLREDIF